MRGASRPMPTFGSRTARAPARRPSSSTFRSGRRQEMLLIQKLLAIAQVAGSVVLYLLLGLSVLSIGMIIERWWFFNRRRVNVDQLGREVLRRLDEGDRAGVTGLLAANRSVEAEVLGAALKWYEAGPDSFQEVLQGALRQA